MAASRQKTNRKSVKKYGRNTRKNATSHKKKNNKVALVVVKTAMNSNEIL